MKDNVTFAKVDVDKLPSIASQENIRSMPTFKFISKGISKSEIIGWSESKVRQLLMDYTRTEDKKAS